MKPVDWISERILFGFLIFTGYFSIGAIAAVWNGITPEGRSVTRDVLMTVGPLLGVIVNAIWKTDKVERLNATTASTLAEKLPDHSTPKTTTIEEKITPTPAPTDRPPPSPWPEAPGV